MPRAAEVGVRSVRGRLLRWYRRSRRDMPWRRTRDPYAIWVSEVMLQQTRVSVVLPYYRRFLRRFPDLASLAGASEDDVLGAWSGLGYYRRARALRRGAIAVLERHGGRVPEDPASLRALPGIGRYTAGAIASIAFDRPEPVVDGNVRRVLSRIRGIRRGREEDLWEIAGTLVRGSSPGDLNQALMELGATVCTARAPECDACPLRGLCRARIAGEPESYPVPKARRATVRVRVAVGVVRRSGRILLERPSDGNPLRGTWDLPAVEISAADDAAASIENVLLERHGLRVVAGERGAVVRHSILHRRLALEAHGCSVRSPVPRRAAGSSFRWIRPADLRGVPVSSAVRKVLHAVRRP